MQIIVFLSTLLAIAPNDTDLTSKNNPQILREAGAIYRHLEEIPNLSLKIDSLLAKFDAYFKNLKALHPDIPFKTLLFKRFDNDGNIVTNGITLDGIARANDNLYALKLHEKLKKEGIHWLNLKVKSQSDIQHQLYSVALFKKIPLEFKDPLVDKYRAFGKFVSYFSIREIFPKSEIGIVERANDLILHRNHGQLSEELDDCLLKINEYVKKIRQQNPKKSFISLVNEHFDEDGNITKNGGVTLSWLAILKDRLYIFKISSDLKKQGIVWPNTKKGDLHELSKIMYTRDVFKDIPADYKDKIVDIYRDKGKFSPYYSIRYLFDPRKNNPMSANALRMIRERQYNENFEEDLNLLLSEFGEYLDKIRFLNEEKSFNALLNARFDDEGFIVEKDAPYLNGIIKVYDKLIALRINEDLKKIGKSWLAIETGTIRELDQQIYTSDAFKNIPLDYSNDLVDQHRRFGKFIPYFSARKTDDRKINPVVVQKSLDFMDRYSSTSDPLVKINSLLLQFDEYIKKIKDKNPDKSFKVLVDQKFDNDGQIIPNGISLNWIAQVQDILYILKISEELKLEGIHLLNLDKINLSKIEEIIYTSEFFQKIPQKYQDKMVKKYRPFGKFPIRFLAKSIITHEKTPMIKIFKKELNDYLTSLKQNASDIDDSSLHNITNLLLKIARKNPGQNYNSLRSIQFDNQGNQVTDPANGILLLHISELGDISMALQLNQEMRKQGLPFLNFQDYSLAEIASQIYEPATFAKIPNAIIRKYFSSYLKFKKLRQHFSMHIALENNAIVFSLASNPIRPLDKAILKEEFQPVESFNLYTKMVNGIQSLVSIKKRTIIVDSLVLEKLSSELAKYLSKIINNHSHIALKDMPNLSFNDNGTISTDQSKIKLKFLLYLHDLFFALKLHYDYQQRNLPLFEPLNKEITIKDLFSQLYANPSPLYSKISAIYIDKNLPTCRNTNYFKPYFASFTLLPPTYTNTKKNYFDYWQDDLEHVLYNNLKRNDFLTKTEYLLNNISSFGKKVFAENSDTPLEIILLQSFNTSGQLLENSGSFTKISSIADMAYALNIHLALLKQYNITLLELERFTPTEILSQIYTVKFFAKIPTSFKDKYFKFYKTFGKFPPNFIMEYTFESTDDSNIPVTLNNRLIKILTLLKEGNINLNSIRRALDNITKKLSDYLATTTSSQIKNNYIFKSIEKVLSRSIVITIQTDLMMQNYNWLELVNFTMEEVDSKMYDSNYFNQLSPSYLKKSNLTKFTSRINLNKINKFFQSNVNSCQKSIGTILK